MAVKAIAMQFVGVIHTRHNDATLPSEAGPTFSSADDTGVVVRTGSYNRPSLAGETIFTSERAINDAMTSLNNTYQVKLGQNTRYTVYGKPCGTPPVGSARVMTVTELAEKVYIEGDTISPGLHDAIKFANRVPSLSASIVVRSEAGPEAEMNTENAASGA